MQSFAQAPSRTVSTRRQVKTNAFFLFKKPGEDKPVKTAKKAKPATTTKPKSRSRSSTSVWSGQERQARNLSARQQARKDSRLLYDASKNVGKGGEKMSREQYLALRRKIGGTARDYFKDWVDVDGEYTDKGYVAKEGATVTALPLLVGVVVAVFGAAAYVVAATS